MSKEDTVVKDEGVMQDAPVTDSPPAENQEPEVADDIMEASLDELTAGDEEETEGQEEVKEEAPAEPETPAEETKTEDQPQGETSVPPEAKSEKSVNRWQEIVNRNKELQAEIDRIKSQKSQVASEQELLNEINPETGEYYTPQEAERLAAVQSREAKGQELDEKEYELQVQSNQQAIVSEAQRALEEFSILDDKSPEYNAQIAAAYDQLLGQSLIRDPNVPEIIDGKETGQGRIIGSQLSPYQLAKTIADATKVNAAKIQAEAQKATEKMLANADVPSGASQATKTKVDPDIEAFDQEAGF
jgi:hypothetical protein